jgi:glycosyltransferase involved in cell wall biosynthesis
VAELISVIVATYNRADALDAVLRSLAHQSDRDFEVVVADDGSSTETARTINTWAIQMPVPLKHVWHPDCGFRLAEIRNRAIRVAAGSYCIFLDGDCIARTEFVAGHRRLAERGWFVTGNRVLLSSAFTQRVLTEHLDLHRWGVVRCIEARARRWINRLAPLLRLPLGPLRKLTPQRWRGARGSNMAFWRADLERVDGFDAAFSGWGREDSDIFVRLIRDGVRRKSGRFGTGVLHLWHPEADRAQLQRNEHQLDEVVRGDRVRAVRGLSLLIEENKPAPQHQQEWA